LIGRCKISEIEWLGFLFLFYTHFMLEQYLPLLVFLILGAVCGLVPITLGFCLGARRANLEKNSPYECGFPPFENARRPFDVRFYLIAILFIIFDLEIVFLFPFAVVFRKIGWPGFVAMGVFLGLLLVGFIYEWKKGALEWE
jgi:NADH-quinone oxidoreductase subunit A